jgi:hypothetical protein
MGTSLTRTIFLISFFTIVCFSTTASFGQSSVGEFRSILREKLAFEEGDLAALQEGQTVVKLLPAQDKREVAVSGIVVLPVPAQVFLESYRENLARKSNPAILEIGKFSNQPNLDDLKDLTFETSDIEDLKNCVVGNCQLKLSAEMIGRLQKEIDWNAPNYAAQATQLLKRMLVDYVRDYLARGDAALIRYGDKEKMVSLAEEQRTLNAGFMDVGGVLTGSRSTLTNVENALVWSKTNFGLKPVIAINHITIYKNLGATGPQILVASKQIYANHYFDSSFTWTGFGSVPSLGSYLIYENRSRADGLGGPFGKLKRGMIENKVVGGLRTILEHSKASLSARALNQTGSEASVGRHASWRRWKVAGGRIFFLLLLITACSALLLFSNYRWRNNWVNWE